jgi:rhomboid protease GluP
VTKLKIRRPSGFRDGMRTYRIFVDGQETGKIRAGKAAEFEVTPGKHDIQIQLDWCRSPIFSVDIAENQTKSLECGSHGNFLIGLLEPEDYLWVRQENQPKIKVGSWTQFGVIIKAAPLTVTILAILVVVYALELLYSVGPVAALSPNIQTLIALGGLYHPGVTQSGQWYRLFTSVMLHASPIHLLFNGYALLIAGVILENYIGRIWLLVVFMLGGLGGSLMSLAINGPNLVSIGASGAIVALFATALICSFRMSADSKRKHLQYYLLQILFFALVPVLTIHDGGHIDIAAHLGGMITGALIGTLLLLIWRKDQKTPGMMRVATALALIGTIGYAYAAVPASMEYRIYENWPKLMSNAEMPKSNAEVFTKSAELIKEYPRDPRALLYEAISYDKNNQPDKSEQDLRKALREKDVLNINFRPNFTLHLEAVLALILQEEGKNDQAMQMAKPLCSDADGDPIRDVLSKENLCG